MSRPLVRAGLLLALAAAALPTPGAAQQGVSPRPAAPFVPKFEAVAETRLLMEGLLQSNYRGLHKLLAKKPADRQTWVFARGQAILAAEGGNLLLLRPPRGQGRDTWMKLAMDMRSKAKAVAVAAAGKDYEGAKAHLADLSQSCKHCHRTFRVNVDIDPEAASGESDAE